MRKILPVLWILLAAFAQAQSGLRKGAYDSDCSGCTFHLFAHGSIAQELTLRLKSNLGLYPPAGESIDGYPITAKRYSSTSGGCEDAVDAKIRFERIGKQIVGGFAVAFANGRQEGKFKVKFHHHGALSICE